MDKRCFHFIAVFYCIHWYLASSAGVDGIEYGHRLARIPNWITKISHDFEELHIPFAVNYLENLAIQLSHYS